MTNLFMVYLLSEVLNVNLRSTIMNDYRELYLTVQCYIVNICLYTNAITSKEFKKYDTFSLNKEKFLR